MPNSPPPEAQLKASQAQVAARKAEAEFSKTTNERWRDSPKGVVSEQERESKKADYESSKARLYAPPKRKWRWIDPRSINTTP